MFKAATGHLSNGMLSGCLWFEVGDKQGVDGRYGSYISHFQLAMLASTPNHTAALWDDGRPEGHWMLMIGGMLLDQLMVRWTREDSR